MKINGKIIEGMTPEVLVIPKGNDEFVIKAVAILSYAEFEKVCPTPKPPMITPRVGNPYPDYDDVKYNAALEDWAKKQSAWTIIESLKATDGLEWETVTADPETWPNYKDDLSSVFTKAEVNRIVDLVFIVNGLDQKKIDEATKRFLAGGAKGQES